MNKELPKSIPLLLPFKLNQRVKTFVTLSKYFQSLVVNVFHWNIFRIIFLSICLSICLSIFLSAFP